MTDRRLLDELASDLLDTPEEARSASIAGLLDAMPSRPGERPEEILLDLHLVDDRRFALALAFRSRRRYEGLRDVNVDHRLFLYLPLSLAQRERVVPLVLFDGTLVLACATLDPELDYVRDRFPNLQLELVLSPRNEILAALQRVGL
jgi:hypothetical protein